jgi:hypothetical protein
MPLDFPHFYHSLLIIKFDLAKPMQFSTQSHHFPTTITVGDWNFALISYSGDCLQ